MRGLKKYLRICAHLFSVFCFMVSLQDGLLSLDLLCSWAWMLMAIMFRYISLTVFKSSPSSDALLAIWRYFSSSLCTSLIGFPFSRLIFPISLEISTLSFRRRRIFSSISSIFFRRFAISSSLFPLP